MNNTISKIKEALGKELPGWEAQLKMVSYDRPNPEQTHLFEKNTRIAAVLVLLYYHSGKLYTVMMQRSTYEGTHSAQVSFPGGKMEATDKTPEDTAKREAWEETGVESEKIEIIGKLTDVYIPPSRFLVKPYVGYINDRPDFVPNTREVEALIETPVFDLLDDGIVGEKDIFVHSLNAEIRARYFGVNGYTIWGATAMIISELKEILLVEGIME